MTVKPRVFGLDDFQLSVAGLRRLGDRPVRLSIQLTGRSVKVLQRLRPKHRMEYLRDALRNQLRQLRLRFPNIEFISRGKRTPSWTIDASVPARQVREVANRPEVNYVYVETIERRRKTPRRRELRWFCVWGVVAVQIEEQAEGLITREDRLMLVRAHDAEGAERRLKGAWLRYAKPYLNSSGYLVRWQLVAIRNVYELNDDAIDPRGTEVYSECRNVRFRPEYRWRPGRTVARARSK